MWLMRWPGCRWRRRLRFEEVVVVVVIARVGTQDTDQVLEESRGEEDRSFYWKKGLYEAWVVCLIACFSRY